MKFISLFYPKKFTKFLLLIFYGIPTAILIRLLYPIIHIRIGKIFAERIGHFAEDSMNFLCDKEFNYDKKSLDLFCLRGKPCNKFFLKLIKREFTISRLINFTHDANLYLPGSSVFIFPSLSSSIPQKDVQNLPMKTQNIFPFSRDEDHKGNNFLTTAGCKDNKRFVCLNIRDSAFLDTLFPDRDNSYHDYRDSDCHSYELAVNELISRGYFVIRMGSAVKEKMNIESDQFLDYPFCSDSSDFLDVWLMANCTFTISTSSGLDSIADIYRKPIAYVNALPLGDFNSHNPRTIWMPKTIVDKTNQALLLREIIDKGVVSFHHTSDLERHHLSLVNNTAEEICEVAKEIEEKVSGSWDNSRANVTQRKHVEHLLSTHWEEFSKYHNKAAFEKESFGHFSESFFNKIS